MDSRSGFHLGHLRIDPAHPAIFASLSVRDIATLTEAATTLTRHPVDVVEWRIDALAEHNIDLITEAAHRLREAISAPLLATMRTSAEGSSVDVSDEQYTQIVTTIAALVDAVDIEMTRRDAKALIDFVHDEGRVVIGSQHFWSLTPTRTELIAVLAKMLSANCDLAKIAVNIGHLADLHQLTETTWTLTHTDFATPVMVMAMGDWGPYSRMMAPQLGCCGTFAYADEPSAPGQISAQSLRDFWTEIGLGRPLQLAT